MAQPSGTPSAEDVAELNEHLDTEMRLLYMLMSHTRFSVRDMCENLIGIMSGLALSDGAKQCITDYKVHRDRTYISNPAQPMP
jgi:ABC-type oligopeptide transport system ATPase subunit